MSPLTASLHLFALVLVISSVDKLTNPRPAARAMRDAGVLPRLTRATWPARALGAVEGVVGLAVIGFGGPVAASAIAVVYGGFLVFLAVLSRRATDASCGCFGQTSAPPGHAHVVVNVIAVAVAAGAALTSADDLTVVIDEGLTTLLAHALLVVVGASLTLAVIGLREDVRQHRYSLRRESIGSL